MPWKFCIPEDAAILTVARDSLLMVGVGQGRGILLWWRQIAKLAHEPRIIGSGIRIKLV